MEVFKIVFMKLSMNADEITTILSSKLLLDLRDYKCHLHV